MRFVLLLIVACSVAAYAVSNTCLVDCDMSVMLNFGLQDDSVSLKQTTTSPTFVNYVTNADG